MGSAKPKDMFELPEYVDLSYETTLMEPTFFQEGTCNKFFKPISGCLEKVYENLQIIIYYLFAVTFGVLLSIWWGVIFGLVNFITVWVAHPFIKLWLSVFRCTYACTRAWTRMTCDPFFESAAIAYTRIRGGFHVTLEKKDVEMGKSIIEDINVM